MTRETKREIMATLHDVTSSKIVAPNTVEYTRSNGERVIRLHQTDILTFSADGKNVTFNDGGWRTVTTKDRMNRFSLASISSLRGSWYLTIQKDDGTYYTVPYFDGMTLVDGKYPDKPNLKIVKDEEKLRKQINVFVAKIKKLDILPIPNSGDCWHCHLFDSKMSPKGKTTNVDHLLSHIRESYIHGSLLVVAMRWAGYTEQSIGLHYQMKLKDTFCRAVRRYLKAQLGIA